MVQWDNQFLIVLKMEILSMVNLLLILVSLTLSKKNRSECCISNHFLTVEYRQLLKSFPVETGARLFYVVNTTVDDLAKDGANGINSDGVDIVTPEHSGFGPRSGDGVWYPKLAIRVNDVLYQIFFSLTIFSPIADIYSCMLLWLFIMIRL